MRTFYVKWDLHCSLRLPKRCNLSVKESHTLTFINTKTFCLKAAFLQLLQLIPKGVLGCSQDTYFYIVATKQQNTATYSNYKRVAALAYQNSPSL